MIELIIVMGIVGVIAGVGLGLFATFDPGRRAALGLVQNTLRQAHNAAVARRAPSAVRFDRATGTLTAESFEVAGTWHFEDESLEGARGLKGIAYEFPAEVLTERGYIGRALDLSKGNRHARVEIGIADEALLDPRRGFTIDVALRPREASAARVVDLGGVVQLLVRTDGGVDGRVVTRRVDELGRAVPGAPILLRTGPGVLHPARWTRVTLTYDRRALRLLADDVPLVLREEDRELWDLEGALVLGDARETWDGALDQLVISTVTVSEEVRLPTTVTLDERTPGQVRFAAGGALDPSVHPGAVRFGLRFEDETMVDVQVNAYGTVE